jgi:hypothetical protein
MNKNENKTYQYDTPNIAFSEAVEECPYKVEENKENYISTLL